MDSGQVMSAPAGMFPHMMSRDMPRHNGVIRHMASLENEALSSQYRGSIRAGSTFPGQSPAGPCSLEQAVSRVVMMSPCPAELNTSVATRTQAGIVGQKQLSHEDTSIAQALPSQTSAGHSVDLCSSSLTSYGSRFTTQHLYTDAMLSVAHTCCAVVCQAAQTATVNVTCSKPISSSSVQYHQQSATKNADEKVLQCSEVNAGEVKDGIVLQQLSDAIDNMVTTDAVKVEPKVEMETNSDSIVHEPALTDLKVEVKTEQLKHEIKSEVASEESVESKDQQTQLNDAAVVSKTASDPELKKEPSRKGLYCSLFVLQHTVISVEYSGLVVVCN